MADSDEDIADISNVLLDSRGNVKGDVFSFDGAPAAKRKKSVRGGKGAAQDEAEDILATPAKSKLSGSSFKNMGLI
jgi:hypothetical protein